MNTSFKNTALSTLGLAAAMLVAPAIAATPQIANADMEQQTSVWAQRTGWQPVPDSWTVLAPGGFAWDSFGGQASPAGGRYWGVQYLDGWGAGVFNMGGIQQSISGLTVGNTYAISFYSMANHTQDTQASENWSVSFGGSTQYGAVVDAAQSGKWVQDTKTFVATATTQTLTFMAQFMGATPGGTPEILHIDGIKLTDVTPVPEPSSLALMFGGLGVLGLLTRRRRPADRA